MRVRPSSGAPDPVSGDCGHDGGGDARQSRSEPRAAPVWGKGMSRAAAGGPTESPDCALTAPPSPVLAVSGRSRTHVTNIAVVPARTGRVRKRGAAQRAGVSRTDTRTQQALLLLSEGLHEERTREKQIIREEAGLGAAAAHLGFPATLVSSCKLSHCRLRAQGGCTSPWRGKRDKLETRDAPERSMDRRIVCNLVIFHSV